MTMTMTRKDKHTLAAGALAIALIVGGGRGLPMYRRWRRESADAAVENVERAARMRALSKRERVLHDTLAARVHRVLSLAPLIVTGASLAAATAELHGTVAVAAAQSNVRIDAVQLGGDTTRSRTFQRVRIRAEVVGDAGGLASFLSRIERGPPLLRVRELTITQSDPNAPDTRPDAIRAIVVIDGMALKPRMRSGGKS